MVKAAKMMKAINVLRDAIGTRDLAVTWIDLLIKVAEAGPEGTTTNDLIKDVGIAQASISRTIKLLSSYIDSKGKESGLKILYMTPHPYHRHRLSILLTPKGKELMKKFEEAL